MKNIAFLVFTSIIWQSCNPDKTTRIDLETPTFKTTDASELFFKNVRQTYYEVEDLKAARLLVYKSKELLKEETLVFPQIVHNWYEDEAYILLEFDSRVQELKQFSLLWKDEKGTWQGKQYPLVDKKVHYEIARSIYNNILDEHQLYISTPDDTLEYMHQKSEQEAFRKTMVDFYRLVNKY